jgi:hypothetical protein
LNSRKRRWLEFLNEYDFEIKNIRGKYSKVVDALNKRVHEMHVTTISMYQPYLSNRILEFSKLDMRYEDIKDTLQQGMS